MKEKELMKVTNKLNTITLRLWKVTLPLTHENEILDFILNNKALGNVATSNEIVYKFWSINKKYKEKSCSSLQKWCNRFLHRDYLTFRRSIHIYKIFLKITWIKYKNFYSITLNLEANMIWIECNCKHGRDSFVFKHASMHNRTEDWINESKYKNTRTRKLKSNSYINCFCFWRKVTTFVNFNAKEGKDTENNI